MRCFVMKTPQYDEDARKFSCTHVFDRFKKAVEGAEDYQHNPGNVFFKTDDSVSVMKKPYSRSFRIILACKSMTVQNTQVKCYVALKIFSRSDQDYKVVYSERSPLRDRERLSGVMTAHWEEYTAEIAEKLKEPDNRVILQPLSTDEINFIQRTGGLVHDIFNEKVIESKDWVTTTKNKSFQDYSKVRKAAEERIYTVSVNGEFGFLEQSYGDNDMKILLARDPVFPKSWYLLKIGTDEDLAAFKEKNNFADTPDLTTLKRICTRAYPFSMLEGDDDFWRKMEMDENSNFILSEEELTIVSEVIRFPLFLTGRAGSGKSTMLQYLFAEYFLRNLEYEIVNPPVYISYSSNLIDNAKKLATNLFTKNHAYTKKLKELKKNFETDIKPRFGASFHVFQELLKDFIEKAGPGVVAKRFSPDKHLTYVKFREKWERKIGRNHDALEKYGPGICWHVIRTYIKGWNADEYLTPEMYEHIGRDNKSVSDETFKMIYKDVWENWYSKVQDEEELWDDQDLVRYCLAPDDDSCETCVTDRFSAVFCDESQDFTRTEIDFILRISSFSQRQVYDENTLYQMPFIFAGDEFQTLNPTGFSWSSLRSYFTTELMHVTKSSAVGAVGAPEPVALTHNYRSPEAITKLANRLQLLNHTRCSRKDKFTPQIPYHNQDSQSPVVCLSPEDPLVWTKLNSVGAVLIIPTSEGQSARDFIEKSSIKKYIEFYEDGSAKNITICNPSQVKGLEYPCVAIYGFDNLQDPFKEPFKELTLQSLSTWYNTSSHADDNESREIEIKYFLNNAYVSATRATNRLFVLTDFSEKSFWAFAFAAHDPKLDERIRALQKMMLEHSKWEPDYSLLGHIIAGDSESITQDQSIDFEELAETLKQKAMELQDPSLMRQAAARFLELGNKKEEIFCSAHACRLEGEFLNAARCFEQIQDYREALKDYWTRAGKEKDKIKETLQYISDLSNKIRDRRITLAQHALNKNIAVNVIKTDLYDLINDFEKNSINQCEDCNLDVYKNVLNLIIKNVNTVQELNKSDVNLILKFAETLAQQYYIEIDKKALGLMAYKAGEYQKAADLLEKLKDRPKEYYKCKCKLVPYPDNLVFREHTGDPSWMEHVVEDKRNCGKDVSLTGDQQKIVSAACLSCGDKDEITESLAYFWTNARNITEAKKYAGIAKENKFSYATDCIEALFSYRWGNINDTPLTCEYNNPELNNIAAILKTVQKIKSDDFIKRINWLTKQNTPDEEVFINTSNHSYFQTFFHKEFGQFKLVKWNKIILFELGAYLEKDLNSCVHAQLFYEWAKNQTTDKDALRIFKTRWIVNRIKQADMEINSVRANEVKYNEIMASANEKIVTLGVKFIMDEERENYPKFDNWKGIFRDILLLPPDKKPVNNRRKKPEHVREHDDKNENKQSEPPLSSLPLNNSNEDILGGSMTEELSRRLLDNNNDTKTVPVDFSDKLKEIAPWNTSKERRNAYYDYQIGDYKFRFNPQKGELSIRLETEDEDLVVKIKGGKFPEDSDFCIRDGRLIKSETGEETPFLFERYKDGIKITDTESGKVIDCPLSKDLEDQKNKMNKEPFFR